MSDRSIVAQVYPLITNLNLNGSSLKKAGFLEHELLKNALKIKVPSTEGTEYTISVGLKKDITADDIEYFNERQKFRIGNYEWFIEFKGAFELRDNTLGGLLGGSATLNKLTLFEALQIIEVARDMFVLAANIANVNSINLASGASYLNNRRQADLIMFPNGFYNAEQYQRKFGLSITSELQFTSVLDWISDINQKQNDSDYNEIASALSYLIKFVDEFLNRSGSRLLWAVAAIEALLGESSEKITSSLVQKIEVILGESASNFDVVKLFKEIYRIRSKVVHGQLPEAPLFSNMRSSKINSDIFQDISEAEGAAVMVLTGLLQNCIINKRKKFSFALNLES